VATARKKASARKGSSPSLTQPSPRRSRRASQLERRPSPPVGEREKRRQPRPPLAGLRVLDLTRVLAGPFCSMILGDMGAEVIKVEEPGKGDDTRGWPPFAGGEATYFLSVNRNKKSLTLNIKAPDGQAILKKLVAKADVVLENFRPGTMERLGFGFAALRKLNPRLIYCSISGFGESGPEASRPGYDLIVQGESGIMDLTGFADGPPVKVGNSVADLVSGMAAAHGVTLALLSRARTGKGQKVEIGMLDVMASLLTYQAGLYWNAGGRPARRGNQHPSIVPYEVFQSQDAYLTLGVANNSLFERMCRAIGREELAKDPRFDSEANRVTNREALVLLLNAIFSTRPASDWLRRLDEAGVPAGRIKTVAEVCDSEHLRARGMFVQLKHPTAGSVTAMGVPIRLWDTPGAAQAPAPLLGQHTDEILTGLLRIPKAKVDKLRADSVV
jgi:crotonobetainyl-CoA:carnitine CoA-transferase CaiB-like acyl-CoA transferase